jgi:deoxycytidylate deaminase
MRVSEAPRAINTKFVGKYMRMAKQVGTDRNPCYTRHIGVVITDWTGRAVLSTGYNGPPRSTPHCDSEPYLREVVWPQLSMAERNMVKGNSRGKFSRAYADLFGDQSFAAIDLSPAQIDAACFGKAYDGCGTCPRRLVGAQSGQRTELCSCEHAERNAIYNAPVAVNGGTMFAWCGVPCFDCTKAVINSGIDTLYCLDDGQPDYSPASRWLFEQANVGLIIDTPEVYVSL